MKQAMHRTTIKIATTMALAAALLTGVSSTSASARPAVEPAQHSNPATSNAPAYLALGDSVPFGYSPLLPIGNPARYVGYPELAAPKLDLKLANLSCPGQTSGGFLSLTGTDFGCFDFRKVAALHTSYSGTQLQAALDYLAAHPRTRLVTIMLGANDLFLCQVTTAHRCTDPAELQATLKTYATNLTTALTAIRSVYHGRLIAVAYYTTNFADPASVVPVQALNATTASVMAGFHGQMADAYTPFARASAPFGGSACAAGLLIKLPDGTCDAHPSPAGARLLTRAVVSAADR
jgi:lysophospholipase L1-like esterase